VRLHLTTTKRRSALQRPGRSCAWTAAADGASSFRRPRRRS